MLTAKFDPQSFFQKTDNVALHVPAGDVFSLLKRSLDLPSQWAALVGRTTGDQSVVPVGGIVEGEGVEDVLFVRSSPVDVELNEEATSEDGFTCSATIQFRVGVIADRGELQSFLRMVVGSRRVVRAEGLATYFQAAVLSGIARFAAGQTADQLVDGGITESATQSIMSSIEPLCFSGGLTIERRPTVQFESTAYQDVQKARERASARRAEHEAASQVDEAMRKARMERLDQLAELLGRLREMATASPDVELPELIRTFSERQRGELYEALFEAEAPATRTQWIVVAAGDELIFFDGRRPGDPVRRLRVEGPAGPARSVQMAGASVGVALAEACGSEALWIGAATGVYCWPVDRAAPAQTFLVDDTSPTRGGFNSIVVAGDRVIATHSELGIIEWSISEPAPTRSRFQSMTRCAKAVRNVLILDGHAYCSIDDRVIRWSIDGPDDRPDVIFTGSGSIITSVALDRDGLYAGNSDGDVLRWPRGQSDAPELIHRGMKRAAESLWLTTTHGVRRLVFTDTSHRVHARVLGDSFACQYEAGGQTLRRVEVAPDLIVATNELRDRLFCWTPGKPGKPSAVIHVAAMTGRTIQDVCLVANPSQSA